MGLPTSDGVELTRESVTTPPIRNRLGIGHLLLWMTATAAVMALFQPSRTIQQAAGGADEQAAFQAAPAQRTDIVLLLIVGPALGAGVAAIPLCVWRLATQRFGFPAQPGHWLLLIIGVWTVMWTGQFVAVTSGFSPDSDGDITMFGLLSGTGLLAGLASHLTKSGHWRLALGLVGGGCCTLSGIVVFTVLADMFLANRPVGLGAIALVGGFVAVLCILGGIGLSLLSGLLDFLHGPSLDLFHWAGVIAFAIVICVPCLAILLGSF